jgi:hypothetical protein
MTINGRTTRFYNQDDLHHRPWKVNYPHKGVTLLANSESIKTTVKKRRPLGVWILPLFVLIFNGYLPLTEEPYYLLMGYSEMYSREEIPAIIFWAIVNICFIIVSVLAWLGFEVGRISIWVMVTPWFGFIALRNMRWLVTTPILKDPEAWIQQFCFILIPVLFIWYFNRRSTREFYKKPRKEPQTQ